MKLSMRCTGIIACAVLASLFAPACGFSLPNPVVPAQPDGAELHDARYDPIDASPVVDAASGDSPAGDAGLNNGRNGGG